ncbi:hypothetical Protein YC6258_05817 [Gynuella sunshinyii YC6258]|uniref:Uncharacterized protein n=1 Tax=Gynuella sunshinyii YC6258 TaxID=1445510 RepID=A0A0C5W5H2_9GAMM|nr:hypothetical Protein YC6258_05817 [Gynuella sunshinyii YC6258]
MDISPALALVIGSRMNAVSEAFEFNMENVSPGLLLDKF